MWTLEIANPDASVVVSAMSRSNYPLELIVLKRLLVSAALIGSALAAPAAISLPASAAIQASTQTSAPSCTYKRDGNVWRCITPGAYCPKAAHNRYGYAKGTNKRYKCVQYTKTTWRWKRA
ncbi:hypothetical protein [Nonomuraea sp. NPDC049784]|uniref:hypothetical protein n=1 Tax=Nonomuraea sp. NPDC049784 TaxID=3154361 RepID=UPI0033E44906